MEYTMAETSKITGLTASTLRYYESEGLLPEIKRDKNKRRYYTDDNLEWISVITCLKNTNMPISQIRTFVTLHSEGDRTLYDRLEIVLEHRENVQKEIDKLNGYMDHINYKVDYYKLACKLGTEKELMKIKYPEHLCVEGA